MTFTKSHLLFSIAGLIIGLLTGFFIGKGVYDKPINAKIERDTVTMWDTIPHWYPVPVEVKPQKPQYKWLTKVEYSTDTVTMHDSVLVEVPIESKHYHADEYDAYISGFEPSLDSIKVYQRTEYITETVTLSKPPNRLSVGFQAGYGYGFKFKGLEPFVGIGVTYRIF